MFIRSFFVVLVYMFVASASVPLVTILNYLKLILIAFTSGTLALAGDLDTVEAYETFKDLYDILFDIVYGINDIFDDILGDDLM
ncbi:hypothetical protein J2Y38_001562 [Flavobacterium sp. 2755]|jgi:hypothetical protein|nr:hypothetical protein [Flavobacterium sp. 2755]